jgi:Transcriptional regulators, similar to M. xanthus CarD
MSILIVEQYLGVDIMFNIGDKIVYPMHGAGVIESIEEKEVLGEKKKYYIMRIPVDGMKVMIPIDAMTDFGIRSIISYSELKNVMDILYSTGPETLDNWNKRYRQNIEKIKGGSIYGMTEVVRELLVREVKKGLSPGEKKILENAKQILYSELMLVMDQKYEDVDKAVRGAALHFLINK